MTLKYEVQVVTEEFEDGYLNYETSWYLLRETDELEDETVIAESKYRNELERLKNYLVKEQRQLTQGDED